MGRAPRSGPPASRPACFLLGAAARAAAAAAAAPAVAPTPLWRTAAPGFDAPLRTAEDAAREAALRAEAVVDPAVVAALHSGPDYGGLVVLRGAVGPGLTRQMRGDAEALDEQGRLSVTGTGEPDTSGRSSPMYEKFFGKCPTLGFLSGSAAEAEGLLGLAFGFAFLSGVAAALNRHRPAGAPAVEPSPRMQLACYDGGGARYGEHTDWCAYEDLGDDEDIPSHTSREEVARRRVSALLYLQDSWSEERGGALRMHGATPGAEVDVMPEGGTLVLFRSRGPVHEVLPTSHRRMALTMWLLDPKA